MQYSQAVAVTAANRHQRSAQDNSDAALVEAIAAGDKRALQMLYRRHHVKVYRFALRFLRDEAAAEDMVSEVFIDVWRQAERFERRSPGVDLAARDRPQQGAVQPAPPLERAARRRGRGIHRGSRRQPGGRDAEAGARRSLRDCLTQLSPAHREIIDLVYYHERSIEEVAEIIGVPANTVKTRMFYARKRIGEMMAARGIERDAI